MLLIPHQGNSAAQESKEKVKFPNQMINISSFEARYCISNICCSWKGTSCLSQNWIRVKLWSSKHEHNLRVIAADNFSHNCAVLCVCVPAVMWMTAPGWRTCSLIYSEAVNLLPPRERRKHNRTPPLRHTSQWILVGCLISPHCFPAPLPPPSLPEGQFLVTDGMKTNSG